MTTLPFLGEILSATAALAWAVAIVLFRRTGEQVSAIAINLFKNALTVVLLWLTLLLTRTPLLPDRPSSDWWLLAASGLIGIALADTLFFLSLARLGAGLVAIVDTLYSPAVIALSFVFLDERIGGQVAVGALLVVLAIAVGTADRPAPGRTRRDILEGVILGAVAMVCTAAGIVMVRNLLHTTPILWVATVRGSFALIGLLPLLLLRRCRIDAAVIFRPGRLWGYAVPASVLGAYLSTIVWLAGFKFTLASVAAVLNQLSTIFTIVLAAIFLKEPLTPRRIVAVVLAVAGAVLVTLR